MYAFNLSFWAAEAGEQENICDFEVRLVYILSSGTMYRDFDSKKWVILKPVQMKFNDHKSRTDEEK